MTLEEIKAAVLAGKTVHWSNPGYVVVHVAGRADKDGTPAADRWLIRCAFNGSCIGLTWRDGTTVNGRPEEFYVARSAS